MLVQNWADLRGDLLVHVKHEAYDVVDDVEDHGTVQRVCRGHDHRVLRVRASLPLHRERESSENLLAFVIDLKMSFRRECSFFFSVNSSYK